MRENRTYGLTRGWRPKVKQVLRYEPTKRAGGEPEESEPVPGVLDRAGVKNTRQPYLPPHNRLQSTLRRADKRVSLRPFSSLFSHLAPAEYSRRRTWHATSTSVVRSSADGQC